MSKADQSLIKVAGHSSPALEEWTIVQDFGEEGTQPRYEVKRADAASNLSIEEDLILVRRTSALDGRQREYTIPRTVLERTVSALR